MARSAMVMPWFWASLAHFRPAVVERLDIHVEPRDGWLCFKSMGYS